MFNVRKIQRKDTVPYTLPGVSSDPTKPIVLHTRLLSFDTREVCNDALVVRDAPKLPRPTDRYDERMANRAEQLAVLARCCIASWENVLDDGQATECTPEKALEFLRFLDEEAGYREEVTAYLLWAQNPRNFREVLVPGSELGKE